MIIICEQCQSELSVNPSTVEANGNNMTANGEVEINFTERGMTAICSTHPKSRFVNLNVWS